MIGIERRNYAAALELRQHGEADANQDLQKIGGHASVWGVLSEEMFGMRERVQDGAFSETIAADPIMGYYHHDPRHVLGSTAGGTLRVTEDRVGLAFEADPPDSAAWVVDLVDRGDVRGASIGFIARDEEWSREDDVQIRTVTRARLFDLGPTPDPAFRQTDVEVRALFLNPHTPAEVRSNMEARLGLGGLEEQLRDLVQDELGKLELRSLVEEILGADKEGSALLESRVIKRLEERATQRTRDRDQLAMRRRRLEHLALV